jgi:septum formation protein
VLASASPARLGLLRRAGFDPEVCASGLDEDRVVEEHTRRDPGSAGPADLAAILARRKAERVAGVPGVAGALVLGCDSLLELDRVAYGKPHTPAVATQRWMQIRGREALLHTGHHLVDTADSASIGRVESTVVRFGEPTDEEIAAYVASGEPLEVAGGFTIDGRGGAFVARIDGHPGNVIGLSLPLLRTLLAAFGIPVTDLWAGEPA